jgi:hypothetical protein
VKHVVCLLIALAITFPLPAQSATEAWADSLFDKGEKLYKNGAYSEALTHFIAASEIDLTLGEGRNKNLLFDYFWTACCYAHSPMIYIKP